MEKKANFRVSRVGTPTIAMGLTAPDVCDVCHAEPPYVLFENIPKEKRAWLCETCFEKGYPKMYSDLRVMEEVQGDMSTVPCWSKGTNRGS